MFNLFILLRTSLKTRFVKELPFFKNKYKRGARLHRQLITRGPRFHAAGNFGPHCCCVFFVRLIPERRDCERTDNLPRCTVILLDYQLHVTVDSFHYLKTFRRSDV